MAYPETAEPVPVAVAQVWRKFVLEQATVRKQRNVGRMVPVMVEMLVEKGVQHLRPNLQRKALMERQRDLLTAELAKITTVLTKIGDDKRLAPFLKLDIKAVMTRQTAETVVAATVAQPAVTIEELRDHSRLIEGCLDVLRRELVTIRSQQEHMAQHRLALTQRLSTMSQELYTLGLETLADLDKGVATSEPDWVEPEPVQVAERPLLAVRPGWLAMLKMMCKAWLANLRREPDVDLAFLEEYKQMLAEQDQHDSPP